MLDVVEQQLLRQDHPRGYGEHRLRMMKPMVLSGSSPRMQGARGGMQRTLRPVRIIPADTGSTGISAINSSSEGDHPRGYGEHLRQYIICR